MMEAIFLFLFATVSVLYFGSFGFVPYDFSFFIDIAWRILNGQVLYKDIGNVTSGPLIYYLQAFFFKIFGVHAFSVLIHAALVNGVVTLLVYFYFSRFLQRPWPLVVSLITAIFFYGVLGWAWMERPTYFFALLSFLLWDLMGQGKIRRVSGALFGIGFLTGLSFWDKQSIASVLTIVQIGLVYFWIHEQKISWRYLEYFLLGLLVPWLILLVLLYGTGSLQSFYSEYFVRALGLKRAHYFWDKLLKQVVFWPILLNLLMGFGAFQITRNKKITGMHPRVCRAPHTTGRQGESTHNGLSPEGGLTESWRATLILAAALFQALNAPLTSMPYLGDVPLSGLGIGWFLSLCPPLRTSRKILFSIRYPMVGAVCLLFLGFGFYSMEERGVWQFIFGQNSFSQILHPFFAGFQIQQPYGEELDRLLSWLKKNLKEGEDFWMFPNQVVAYAALTQVSTAPLVTMEVKTLRPEDDATLRDWLEKKPPTYLILEKRNTQSILAHSPLLILSTLPSVQEFMELHYRQDQLFPGYEIYKWVENSEK